MRHRDAVAVAERRLSTSSRQVHAVDVAFTKIESDVVV